jgi:hypothetical protein
MTDFMHSGNGGTLRQGCVVQLHSEAKQHISMTVVGETALFQMPIYTEQE